MTIPPKLPISNESLNYLRSVIKGDIVLPDDEDYRASIARWSASTEKPAGMVVHVKDEDDIHAVLKVAIKDAADLAIKGGGHSFSGASSSNGGIVIDLARFMKTVTVNPDEKSVTVQGGARWEEVDTEANNYGLACVGGTINNTGVAGLALGGGYGWLTPRYGLVIDNLLSARIITGTLEHLSVSATSNPALFDAIKGGGCNFGVVTEFVFRLHEQKNLVWLGLVSYPIPTRDESDKDGGSTLDQMSRSIQAWYDEVSMKYPDASIRYFIGFPSGTDLVQLILFYNGGAPEAETCFKTIWDLPALADKKQAMMVPYPATNATEIPWGLCRYSKSSAIPRFPVGSELASICSKVLELHHNTIYTDSTVAFEDLSPRSNLNDASGLQFAGRSRNIQALCILEWYTEDPTSEKTKKELMRARELAKGIIHLCDPGEGLVYGNYVSDVEGHDRAEAIFGSRYPVLQGIKARHDPNQLFDKWFPIKPAAPY